MAVNAPSIVNKPAWVDLSTSDVAAAAAFYRKVFGWQVDVSPDPQYGGYAIAKIAGEDVAGIGPSQSPDAPTAWMLYMGTTDAEALGAKVQAAGGTVIAPSFDVGNQGRMAVFQDPAGAFISAWQPADMGGFHAGGTNQYGWAELNARGLEPDLRFYSTVFGWDVKQTPMGEGQPLYTQFQMGDERIAGAMEMSEMVPAQVPSYWLVYFNVADVDATFHTVVESGGHEILAPQDFPGGRFAIVNDPQGAAFGLLKTRPRQG